MNNVSQFYWDNIKSRTRIFYCTHFNRNNAFFKRHELMKDIETKSSSRKAEELFKSIFGFNRIRRDLRNNIIDILTYMVDEVKTSNFNHYLAKSCPLPENWRERKTKILKYVDKSRDQKANIIMKNYLVILLTTVVLLDSSMNFSTIAFLLTS